MKGEIRLTASGAVFGTPEYMAPEQARGAPLTGKADLYALGCVLYEMLVGDPPFDGPAPELILKHIRASPQAPSESVPNIPRALDEVVLQLLDKEPSRRHVDAHHVLEELRAVQARLPAPNMHRTLQEDSFADAINTLARPRKLPETFSSSADAWDRKLARFRDLMGRAHPNGGPAWLTDAIMALERHVGELARRRTELNRSASRANQHEEELRTARLRIGTAIDVLGRDESRAHRQLEAIAEKVATARVRLVDIDEPLRDAWAKVEPFDPDSEREIELDDATALRDAGQLASIWVEARALSDSLERDVSRLEQERDDVRFQIAQLKGRLGTLNAECDLELDALRERTRQVDVALQELLDKIVSGSERIVKHFLEFPELRALVREVER